MKYTDLLFDKSVWGFFPEKRGVNALELLPQAR